MSIYVRHLHTRYGPYAIGVPVDPPTAWTHDLGWCGWLGYLNHNLRDGAYSRNYLHDLKPQYKDLWCASYWETIPVDELWRWLDQPRSLNTYTSLRKLDFRNTAFEHRSNLNDLEGGDALYQLADLERATWGDSHCEFIPFKRPHPQGYQGVWGNFDPLLKNLMADGFPVKDAFESGVHTLKLKLRE